MPFKQWVRRVMFEVGVHLSKASGNVPNGHCSGLFQGPSHVKFDGNTDEEFLRMLVAHEKYDTTAGNIKGAKKAAAKVEKLDMIEIKTVKQAKDLHTQQKKYEKLVADAFKMYGDIQGTKLSQLWESAVQEVCVQPRGHWH